MLHLTFISNSYFEPPSETNPTYAPGSNTGAWVTNVTLAGAGPESDLYLYRAGPGFYFIEAGVQNSVGGNSGLGSSPKYLYLGKRFSILVLIKASKYHYKLSFARL